MVVDIPMDDKSMPLISVEHTGKVVHAIFNKREEYLGEYEQK